MHGTVAKDKVNTSRVGTAKRKSVEQTRTVSDRGYRCTPEVVIVKAGQRCLVFRAVPPCNILVDHNVFFADQIRVARTIRHFVRADLAAPKAHAM